jgi:hypothetical protein
MFLAANALRSSTGSRVHGPIPEWPAVRFFAPRNGARDADKLGAHLIGRQADLRVAVSCQIDELEVRSDSSESIRPSARSAHRSQLGKAGLERPH